jgi:hypothetical protein
MKIIASGDIVQCSLVEVHQCVRGTYCLHPHPDNGGGSKQSASTTLHSGMSQKAVIFTVTNSFTW